MMDRNGSQAFQNHIKHNDRKLSGFYSDAKIHPQCLLISF